MSAGCTNDHTGASSASVVVKMGRHESWSACHCCCKMLWFLFVFAFILGAIAMLVMGALCYSDSASAYAYCTTIGAAGRLGLIVAGAVLLAIMLLVFIIHCLCCIVTCGNC